jgi:death on curing protein
VTIWYPDLADYLAVAAAITGLDAKVLTAGTTVNLADSALHAPSASFGGEEFHPDFCEKAAVLLVRLTKNHPLIDGNKRAAWVTLRLFIETNSWRWHDYPSVDKAERLVLGVAAGELDEPKVTSWLADRISPADGASS